ncbi:hypothetical protein V6N11_022156 [Hibiscus sabdariffa]|uniref:Uncharacterized protein n=1 Tax=Hibiscus sabdariffa TaxID=183260 RepID=A0ABR2TJ51_9ROSI
MRRTRRVSDGQCNTVVGLGGWVCDRGAWWCAAGQGPPGCATEGPGGVLLLHLGAAGQGAPGCATEGPGEREEEAGAGEKLVFQRVQILVSVMKKGLHPQMQWISYLQLKDRLLSSTVVTGWRSRMTPTTQRKMINKFRLSMAYSIVNVSS